MGHSFYTGPGGAARISGCGVRKGFRGNHDRTDSTPVHGVNDLRVAPALPALLRTAGLVSGRVGLMWGGALADQIPVDGNSQLARNGIHHSRTWHDPALE